MLHCCSSGYWFPRLPPTPGTVVLFACLFVCSVTWLRLFRPGVNRLADRLVHRAGEGGQVREWVRDFLFLPRFSRFSWMNVSLLDVFSQDTFYRLQRIETTLSASVKFLFYRGEFSLRPLFCRSGSTASSLVFTVCLTRRYPWEFPGRPHTEDCVFHNL